MLIKCPECGKEISDTCNQCIHCGYRFKKEVTKTTYSEKSFSATRSDAGSIKGIAIFDIIGGVFLGILGILGIVFGVYMSKNGDNEAILVFFITIGVILLSIMVFGVLAGILVLESNRLNRNNQEDLLVYTAGNDVFEAINYKGIHKTIKVVDYYDIKCNLFTDNLFVLYYKNENKRIKKIKLGYCGNRVEAKRFFSNLALEKRAELKGKISNKYL